jgi:hypothetical protein
MANCFSILTVTNIITIVIISRVGYDALYTALRAGLQWIGNDNFLSLAEPVPPGDQSEN